MASLTETGWLSLIYGVLSGSSSTSNGVSYYRQTALSSTALQIKSSSGNFIGYSAVNQNTVPVYVKFYDNAAPTVGTTIPVHVVMIPASNGTTPGARDGALVDMLHPRFFTNAIYVVATGALADTDTSTPSSAIYFEGTYL
jgi:hypothetical protein